MREVLTFWRESAPFHLAARVQRLYGNFSSEGGKLREETVTYIYEFT